MRAWMVAGAGPPAEVLELREVEPPRPGPGFLRLRVEGAALGLPDVLMCAGTYPLTPARPFTPGQEAVGTVSAVGPDVDPALVGTRQMGVTAFYLGAGGFADEALAAADTVFPAPDTFDTATAASFHIPFHTAWIALRDRAGLAPGEDLVVLGAAGGTGTAAVLLGQSLGARVIAVAGGAAKTAYCRNLGADVVVDHHEEDLAEAIRASTAGQGAGVVFDPVGGAPGERAVGAMRGAGRLLLVGFASGRWPTIDPGAVVEGNVTVMGVYVGAYDRTHAEATYTELHSRLERGRLRPLPTEQVAFTDLPRALGALADHTVMGRLVLSPRRPSEASE